MTINALIEEQFAADTGPQAARAPRRVRKAIFPVAGLGTRSLPATKAIPKEMLTVVDKPVIQHAVEEAMEAGIEEFIFVTGRGKSAIQDHFDRSAELNRTLQVRGKTAELDAVLTAELPAGSFSFVTQPEPLGLGHAVWCARQQVGQEPFAVLLPDEIFLGRPGVLKQMMAAYDRFGGGVIAVREVPKDLTRRYGILDVVADDGEVALAKGLVEKPKPADAPSNLSIVGRYILPPEVMTALDRHEKGAGGEIQLTDAIKALVDDHEVRGVRFAGRRFDCGAKAEFVLANLAFALDRSDLSDEVRFTVQDYLRP